MKKPFAAIAFLAGLASLAVPTRADDLLGVGGESFLCKSAGNFSQVELFLEIGNVTAFQTILDANDSGVTFVIDSGPAFDAAVDVLTNGTPNFVIIDALGFPFGGGCGAGSTEEFFFTFDPCVGDVDFQGATIDRIELTIVNFEITPSSFTEFELDTQVAVYGDCPECFLVIGDGRGNETFTGAHHEFSTQLSNIFAHYPVTMEDMPVFPITPPPTPQTNRLAPRLLGRWTVQVLMYNPTVFPENPEQWTNGLDVLLFSNGQIVSVPYGDNDGMNVWTDTYESGGTTYLRFPFNIEGL